jgi:predicted Zn-dependent peptidase
MLYADSLFGGYGMSRLFKVVREEHGLAYAVSSNYHRARGSIVAQAAVDNARAEQAIKLIRSEFKRLQDDGFSDEEFAAVRESLIEGRKSSWDSQGARVSDAVFQYISGFQQSFEEQITELRNVTPKQVRAALKKLKPHGEYRLG